MAFLSPDTVYLLALRAIPKVIGKYPVADGVEFARILTSMAFQESCIRKTTKDFICFDSEARPLDKKGNRISSAYGLTQVLDDTQREIEKLMKWPKRPLDARSEPQYALDLSAAYLAYFYGGGRKTPRGDWFNALVAYHDGHYSKNGAGHAYAREIMKHKKLLDFPTVVQRLRKKGPELAQLEYINRAEFR